METVRIRDPGWKKVGSGIRDKHPGFAILQKKVRQKNIIPPFLLLLLDLGSEIRDLGWKKSGSGINIRDPQLWLV
jgi:hypothetical protein